MPTYKVTDSNTGKTLRLTGDSPPTEQELEQIFSEKPIIEKPIIAGVPRYAETEELIKSRRNPWVALAEEGNKPARPGNILQPFSFGLKGAEALRSSVISPIASTGLAIQQGRYKDIPRQIWQGLTGQRKVELGDIPRAAGVSEPLSAAIGLGSELGLYTPKATFGTAKKMATHPVTLAKEAGGEIADLGSMIKSGVQKVWKKRPKIMGEKWFESEAKLAQKTAGGLEKMRGAAYENIYSKIDKAPIEPVKVNDILQKYDLVDELGGQTVTNVKDAKAFSDELAQYIPQQIKQGKTFGKGGFANPKIRAEKAAKEIKDLIYSSAGEAEKSGIIEKGATQSLKDLDKLAREKLYPRAEKIRAIGGTSPEPKTSGIAGAYKIFGGSEGKVGERLAIKRSSEALKELGQYIAPEKQVDLGQAIKDAEQLAKNMGKYRLRQQLKIGTGAGALGSLATYLLHRGIAEKVLKGKY